MSTYIQGWSWNTCFELHKRLSVWKCDILKRSFSLMRRTLDCTVTFCKPAWLIWNDGFFKCLLMKFDLYFSPVLTFRISIGYISTVVSDHISHIVRSENALQCAPVGLESGPSYPFKMRNFRRLASFLVFRMLGGLPC